MNANWDHFTKALFPESDRVIVWNEFNKNQLVEYYGYKPEDIFVAGIPHQDHFVRAKNKFLPKKEFLKRIGAAENKRLITYATLRASDPEPEVVEIICEAIKYGKIKYPVHLRVRIHPLDTLERYEKLKKYGDIVTVEEAGKGVSQRFWSPTYDLRRKEEVIWCPDEADMTYYANLLSCSDILVNVASSVSLDAAAFDVPIIGIGFDGHVKKEYLESTALYFAFTHYKFIPESGGARIARNADELIKFINMYLDSPKLDSEGRRKIVEEQCGKQDGKCGERIANYVLNFLESVR